MQKSLKTWFAASMGILLIGILVSFQTIHQCLHHHNHQHTEQLQDDHCELCKIKSSVYLPTVSVKAPAKLSWVVQPIYGWTSSAAKSRLLDFHCLRGPPVLS